MGAMNEDRKARLWQRIDVPSTDDSRGRLSWVESGSPLPFIPRRLYIIRDVPVGASRGHHAHKELQQFFMALHGSFVLRLADMAGSEAVKVEDDGSGVLVPAGVWRVLDNFTEGCIGLVAVSSEYDPDDYIWSWAEYQAWKFQDNS